MFLSMYLAYYSLESVLFPQVLLKHEMLYVHFFLPSVVALSTIYLYNLMASSSVFSFM